jgi:DNA-binding response OmpR family regulator
MNSKTMIWILEDDSSFQFVYEEILGLAYSIRIFSTLSDFKSALTQSETAHPHLVVADLRLPDGTFLEFLSSSDFSVFEKFPFLVVSSVDDLDALRVCFEKGASDYLTKPFSKNELLIKIERVLKATVLTLDPATLTLIYQEKTSDALTSKEFQIASLLRTAPNHGASRKEILDRVWGRTYVNPNTLEVHIYNLRRKLLPLGLEVQVTQPGYYALKNLF